MQGGTPEDQGAHPNVLHFRKGTRCELAFSTPFPAFRFLENSSTYHMRFCLGRKAVGMPGGGAGEGPQL